MRRTEKNIAAPRFTPREKEILNCISKGLKNKEIAEELFIDVKTVEAHKSNLIRKLSLKNTSSLIIYSIIHIANLIAIVIALLPQDIF